MKAGHGGACTIAMADVKAMDRKLFFRRLYCDTGIWQDRRPLWSFTMSMMLSYPARPAAISSTIRTWRKQHSNGVFEKASCCVGAHQVFGRVRQHSFTKRGEVGVYFLLPVNLSSKRKARGTLLSLKNARKPGSGVVQFTFAQ